ncbi:AI-2E family transporter [Pseudorhizobium halotolerans]|uniref:AI-2E family transporter n=1 Tax=Pseudorhizobium halotolerans TaxID=1233081 RepID=A0ABN7JQ81_9HYPH|nr:AI-2E family transporter [Pseudorhizobium halotolerans]CAD7034449.1 AI-2E family transporter [Pseudorhizobium halotolerans]
MSVQRFSFYVLLVLVTIAFVAVMLPFYSAIFWAVVLAIIFFPVHARLEARVGERRNLAAVLSVTICVCLVIVPGMVILSSLVREGNNLYQQIDTGQIDIRRMLQQLQNSLPEFVRQPIESLELTGFDEIRDRITSVFMEGGRFFAGRALSIGQNTLQFFIVFGVMLYLLFFLFRDGRWLIGVLRRSSPLSESHTQRFAAKFASVVRATVRGNLIIALIQGAIGGLTFWALGIYAALLWGVLMAFLSLLPAVGAAVVWVPTAIYLALTGAWLKAAILVFVGVLVIGLVDNLLRPPLVGKETRLPDYVVLISTIGGLSLFGVNGFIIGPLVAALFISAWSIFTEEKGLSEH